jgi:hypothetical protein
MMLMTNERSLLSILERVSAPSEAASHIRSILANTSKPVSDQPHISDEEQRELMSYLNENLSVTKKKILADALTILSELSNKMFTDVTRLRATVGINMIIVNDERGRSLSLTIVEKRLATAGADIQRPSDAGCYNGVVFVIDEDVEGSYRRTSLTYDAVNESTILGMITDAGMVPAPPGSFSTRTGSDRLRVAKELLSSCTR